MWSSHAMLASVIALAVGSSALAATRTWTGNAGNSSWHDANNWLPVGVPGATDDVVIDVPAAISVNFTTGTATINSLECAETLNLNGGTLILSTVANVTGTIAMNGGTMQGGTWTFANPLTASSNSGNRLVGVTVNGDMVLSAASASLRFADFLTVNGQVVVSGANARLAAEGSATLNAEVILQGTSGLNNRTLGFWGAGAAQTLTLGPSTVVRGSGIAIVGSLFGAAGGTKLVVNQGLISGELAGQTLTLSSFSNLSNEGTIHAVAGTVSIQSASWISSGTQIVESGAALVLGGNFTTSSLGTFVNNGGSVSFTGNLDNTASTLTLDGGTGSWTLNGGTMTGGTVALTRGAMLSASSNSGNRLVGVTVNGDMVLSAASASLRFADFLTVNGQVVVSGANARLAAEGSATLNAEVILQGTSGLNNRTLGFWGAGAAQTLTLGPSTVVRGSGIAIVGSLFGAAGGTKLVVNQGLISGELAGQTLTLSSFSNLSNEGTIHAVAGTVSIQSASWISSGTQIVESGAALVLGGNFTTSSLGTFVNNGGSVSFTGNLDNTASTLTLDGGTGSWTLNGGTMTGGTVALTRGAMLSASSNSGNRLVGVTVNGDMVLSAASASLRFADFLTVNGQVVVSGANARLAAEGSATLNAEVILQGTSGLNNRTLGFWGAGAEQTLTLGPSTVVRGSGIAIVGSLFGAAGGTKLVVNQGLISGELAGQTLTLSSLSNLSNQGTIHAVAGTVSIQSAVVTNYDGGTNTLMGGTWSAGPGGGTIVWPAATIRTLGSGAQVVLDGPGSSIPAVSGLTTIGSGAAFELAGGRDFAASPLGGTFTNNGAVVLGAQSDLAVSGIYEQGASGALSVVFSSAAGPVRLTSTGNLELNGLASLSFAGGFTPALGETITFLSTSGGARLGEFTSVLHPLPRLCTIDITYGPTSVAYGLETEPPVAVCKDITITLDANGNATITPDDIDDGSSDNCIIAFMELSKSAFTCADVGSHTVTLTVRDSAGNESSCTATVTVEATGRFIGSGGGSWFNAGNWCTGVPTEMSDVTIRKQVIIDALGAIARNVTIESGGELVISSATGASLEVIETLSIQAGGVLTIGLNGAVFVNTVIIEAGGTLNLFDASALLSVVDLAVHSGSLVNWVAGTIEVSGTLTSVDPFAFGCLAQSANLRLVDGLVSAPGLIICNDGILSGDGIVSASTLNGGLVSPGSSAGELAINGNFTQTASGALLIQLGGLEAGVEFDRVAVSGLASLGGALHVELINGFVPVWSDTFGVLVAGDRTGSFATTSVPTLPLTLFIDPQIGASGVLLKVRAIGDINDDGVVDGADLAILLGSWGPCPGCPGDLNGDGVVDGIDIAILLGAWGPVP
ncbi:MAG: hypothetical protein KF724_06340 [Phycisphaeraceae bacterium]|nr:hypothetical protein [Phycisphaeraceae bacterium]